MAVDLLLELLPDMRPNVLIVEDDSSTREALRRVLEEEGCTVDEAADGEKAVGKLAQHSYDAIVLDIALPKLSGTDVMEYIASTTPRLLESIVVVTASKPARSENSSPPSARPSPSRVIPPGHRLRPPLPRRHAHPNGLTALGRVGVRNLQSGQRLSTIRTPSVSLTGLRP